MSRREVKRLLEMVFFNKHFVTEEAIDAFFAERLSMGDGLTIRSAVEAYAIRENTLDDRLENLGNQPVLIIQSANDEIAPMHLGYRFHEGIPGSQLEIIENSGHSPLIENAEEFNKILLRFLAN